MSAAHPGLLALGLALAALVWWLHRARSRGQALHVPSLILFGAIQPPTPVDPQAAARADPAWIRRALLVCALCVALAGLRRDVTSGAIVVWVDGAPSMMTLESDVSRLDRALATLKRDLADRGPVDVTLRSLARPGFVTHLTPPFTIDSSRVPQGMPVPPESASLSRNAEQWVVTDGASATLARWLATARIDRVIQVGSATENAAVARIALRASLSQAGRSDVLVAVYNAGRHPAWRRLELRVGMISLPSSQLDLLPGETRSIRIPVAARSGVFAARLLPADALSLDDALTLNVPAPLDLRIAVDPDCGPALEAALGANMAVTLTEVARAQLLVDCSDRWRQSLLPRVHLRRSFETQPVAESAYWNREIVPRARSLSAGLRMTGQALSVDAGETAVLTAGAHALVVLRTEPTRLVESILDLGDNSLTARAEYPLLVTTLLDVAAGDELLGRVASEVRSLESVNIAPHALVVREAHTVQRQAIDLTAFALALALLALLWEIAVAARSLWLNRQYYLGRLG